MPLKNEYDAIVVGSGITGGWAAKELTEKGLRVLLLERGREVIHGTDYKTEHVPSWEFAYRGLGERILYKDEYAVQSQCYAFGEATKHFFVNDQKSPYTHDADKPFSWIRGYHLGGRSLMWARQSYRLSDLDFGANARDGIGIDWPVRYKEIAPWYDYVEEYIGVSGQAEGLSQLPDGKFQPPMQMNCVELAVKDCIDKKFTDRKMTIGRTAVLTQSKPGRAPCHYCGPCQRGCSTGSYFSSLSATLPAAGATQKLTIRPNSIVHSVIYDENKDKASGVRVIDAHTKDALEFSARIIFLCASTLGTTQILLNSSTPRFSGGLANSSGVLGRYLMDHTYASGAGGTISGFEDMYYSGRRPNGIYIPRFQNIKQKHPDYLRGYGFQGGASRPGWRRGMRIAGFGKKLKQTLREPGPWEMRLSGFGECLPRKENFVALHKNKVDAWGIPQLKINCTWSENEIQIKKDAALTAAEILEACGAKDILPFNQDSPPGLCIHEMGTARMGKDPKTSVLNKYNQCYDVPNLFVTDGSFMASSACQNPSLTYMAFTARACDYAIKEMKRGNL